MKKKCPKCSYNLNSVLLKYAVHSKNKSEIFSCPDCASNLNLAFPSWAEFSIPTGVIFGLLIGGFIYFPLKIEIKLFLMALLTIIVFITYIFLLLKEIEITII